MSRSNSSTSRRSFLRYASLAAAAPILTEAHFAQAAFQNATAPQAAGGTNTGGAAPRRGGRKATDPDMVIISANENPLGPCEAALAAIHRIAPTGGRYDFYGETDKLTKTFAAQNGLKEENIAVYAGSSEPLHYSVLAFTSPSKGLVMADPSYEAPMRAAQVAKAKITKIKLTDSYTHDLKAMMSADPTAGVIYICNPNNPTGTITSKADIVAAYEARPKGAIFLVDEAYIHLSDAENCLDMVAAGKDVIVLRTFSKIYGMAGIRAGFAVARPDLLAKLTPFGQNAMPVTGSGAANASLLDETLIPTRKKIIADTRTETIAWLKENNYKVIGDSQSNCFMIDTGRNGRSVIAAMAAKKVQIGRTWPIWPNVVRVSVGTPAEMAKFKVAFKEVMDTPVTAFNDTHDFNHHDEFGLYA